MIRFVAALVGVLGLTAGVARADIGMLPNGATITWDRLFITEDGVLKEPSDPDAQRRFFNLAHCACSQAGAATETTFEYELSLNMEIGLGRPLDVWVGTECDADATTRTTNCRQLTDRTIPDIDNLFPSERLALSLYDVINAKDTMGACRAAEGAATVWLLADTDGDATYDFSTTQAIGTDTANGIPGIDTIPPPLPDNFDAAPGEGSIELSWDPPDGREEDLYFFQALCARVDDTAVLTAPPAPQYQTTLSVCGIPQELALTASELDVDDREMAVPTAPAAFTQANEMFICGEQDSGTARGLTIRGLENDVPYKVALLAIDFYGNVTGTYFTRTITPREVTDFWEDLHDRGSAVEGGCLLSQTYGDSGPLTKAMRTFRDDTLARSAFGRWLTEAYYATLGAIDVEGSLALRVIAAVLLAPLVALALLWHVLTLPGLLVLLVGLPLLWRRRRALARLVLLRRAATPAAVAMVVIAAGSTAAQADDFTPYWEDPSEQASYDDEQVVKWHAGIRLGMYIPEIDLQAGENAITGRGPYKAMFGNYVLDGKAHDARVWQILPMLDVDRILWRGFGQLGIGGSIGYMQKSAYAYLADTSEDDPGRPRSSASKTTFRLIPMAATVSYRFTWLDDNYGIPVVPYVRGGLSYYAWWFDAPDGELSSVCKDPAQMAPCDENTARGGSFGYQGSIGIAIRAERIDPSAAMSMSNSGILHAGFYGEFQYAKVDGFGDSSKLSVGDNTWFAGVNFEF